MKDICNKHVVRVSVLISILLVILYRIVPWNSMFVVPYASWVAYLVRAICCIVLIYILGIARTAGFGKKGFLQSLLYGVPFYIIGVGSVILSNWGVEITSLELVSVSNLVRFTITMVLVAVNEELWLRALVLNLVSSSQKISEWKAIIISALIFALLHMVNFSHMQFVNVLVQIINAFAGGILFGAIYIKQRNIWGTITIHFIVDWISLVIGSCFMGANSVLSVQMSPGLIVIMICGGIFIPVISACWIMSGKRKG